jgi:hypothetical protein
MLLSATRAQAVITSSSSISLTFLPPFLFIFSASVNDAQQVRLRAVDPDRVREYGVDVVPSPKSAPAAFIGQGVDCGRRIPYGAVRFLD